MAAMSLPQLFPNAQNVIIRNCQFTQVVTCWVQASLIVFLILTYRDTTSSIFIPPLTAQLYI